MKNFNDLAALFRDTAVGLLSFVLFLGLVYGAVAFHKLSQHPTEFNLEYIPNDVM